MFFTSTNPYEGMTSKEEAVARLKRHRRIMEAVKLMRASADKAYISERGYMKPSSGTEGLDWKEKIDSLRLGVRAGKSRMKKKGHAVFAGR